MKIYPLVFDHVLRRLDPETCHELTVKALGALHAIPVAGPFAVRSLFGHGSKNKAARLSELHVPGHFGLAAGFDKDARLPLALIDMGFSHVEVGTITPYGQPGNEKKRCFRLVADRSLINRMGFNNEGAEAAAKRLRKIRATRAGASAVIGVNIGKNKTTELEDAAHDYRMCAKTLAPFASYISINVSSPNTPNLRSLQAVDELRPILQAVVEECALETRTVPVFVKIAPDLHDDDVRAVAKLAIELGLTGIIASNTTIARPESLATPRSEIDGIGAGGLSGPILADRALEILDLLVSEREGISADGKAVKLALISCGGVVTGADVKERLDRGADLVQGFTAMIYEGPSWPGRVHRELAELL